MSTDNKTLADVQPGGRVRLGDSLPPLPEPSVTGYGFDSVLRRIPMPGFTAEQMRDYARAALPAQPSPGSQGDALATLIDQWMARADRHEVSALEADSIGGMQMAVAVHEARAAELNAAAHSLKEALAARQPVGEPVGYFDPDVLAHLTEGLIDPVGVLRRKPNGKCNVPVWLAPPAQAVDLAEFKALYRAYVRLLESGRDRIIDLGGTCDPVDVMEANDVDLQAARRVLDSQAVGK